MAATVALVVIPFAAMAQASGTIRPARVEQFNGVAESTLDVFPQIQENYRARPMNPENPYRPFWRTTGTRNNLRIGGLTNNSRISFGGAMRFPGMGATGYNPPDCDLAVGPNHIVEVVNSDIAFFTKSGTLQFRQSFEGAGGFFGSVGAGTFCFDPKVMYDSISGRFIMVGLDLVDNPQGSSLLVAVSQTSDPNGVWFKYKINSLLNVGGSTFWLDYPGFGFNKDAVVVSGNMFGFSSGFGGVQFIVLPKAPMLTGAPVTATYLRDPNGFTAQIARTTDKNVGTIYGVSDWTTSAVRTYAIVNPATNPTVQFASVTVPQFTRSTTDAASTGGRVFDAFDARLFNAWYRNGKMVTAHTVAVGPGDSRNAVRWYELNLNSWPTSGNPTFVQGGNIVGASGEHTHMPAVGVNRFGDISVIYTRSSTSITADVMVAGRKASDPAGTMGAPRRLGGSGATYGFPGWNRWGDYFGVEVDPVDDFTFWGVGQIGAPNGNWATIINSWTVTTPASGGGTAVGPTSVVLYQGSAFTGNAASITNSDDQTADTQSVLVSNLGQIAAFESSFTVAPDPVDTFAVNLEARAVTGATGMVWLFNWNTNKYDHVKSFPLKASDTTVGFAVGAFDDYINNATREVKAVLRAVLPMRGGRGGRIPPQFVLRADQLKLVVTSPAANP